MHQEASLSRGLLGHWPGERSPGGIIRDRSPEGNDGNVGIDARWIWFTNPRAVRHVGDRDRTYFGYLGGPTGRDIVAAAYDHDEASLSRITLDAEFSADDHTNPSIFVRENGIILVFWARHNGDALHYARSTAPEDITSLERLGSIDGTSLTYPNPVRSPFGDDAIYLFYRDRVHTRDATDDRWGYQGDGCLYVRTTKDGGQTWSEETLLAIPPDGHYSLYCVPAVGDEAIHLFFTDAERGGDAPKWNVMYAKYSEDGAFYTATDDYLAGLDTFPLEKHDFEVVYDSSARGNHYAWLWDAAVDDAGRPVVAYATFPSTLAHEYRWARHDGDEWTDTHLVDAGRYIPRRPIELHYSGGLALDRDDPTVVYGCVSRGDNCVLRRFETETGGRTWSETTVANRSNGVAIRPVVPRNASPELPVLWLCGSYKHMNTSQTVLRGLPGACVPGEDLWSDRTVGVDLGVDLYGQSAFTEGITVLAEIRPENPAIRGVVANFGSAITLGTALDDRPGVTCTLKGPKGTASVTAPITSDDQHMVTAVWDRETLSLTVAGKTRDETDFHGPISFDDDWASWTLLKGPYLMDDGFAGEVTDLRLYNRPLSTAEVRALVYQ